MKSCRIFCGVLLFWTCTYDSGFHHLILYSTGEHRATTKISHLTRLCAKVCISIHPFPAALASSTTVRFKVDLRQPLFREPFVFEKSGWLAMSSVSFRMVWPIQFHFLLLIITSSFSIPVSSHKSSFLMVFGQYIFTMRFKHLLTKTWIFLTIVLATFRTSHNRKEAPSDSWF